MYICNVVPLKVLPLCSQQQTANAETDFHKLSFNLYRCKGDLSTFTQNNIQPTFATTLLE